jgi:hypothetical protein
MIIRSFIFWDIKPCIPVKVNRRFGERHRLQLQGRKVSLSWKRRSGWREGGERGDWCRVWQSGREKEAKEDKLNKTDAGGGPCPPDVKGLVRKPGSFLLCLMGLMGGFPMARFGAVVSVVGNPPIAQQ